MQELSASKIQFESIVNRNHTPEMLKQFKIKETILSEIR